MSAQIKAYMDDNLLYQHSWKGLLITQLLYYFFEPMGLKTAPHTCCYFTPLSHEMEDSDTCIECMPPGETTQARNCTFAAHAKELKTMYKDFPPPRASWTRAAQDVLCTSPETIRYAVGHSPWKLTYQEVYALAKGQDRHLLARLVAMGCNCKSKTGLLPGIPLTEIQVAMIDVTPMGAIILKPKFKGLRLPLLHKYRSILPTAQNGEPNDNTPSSEAAMEKRLRQLAAQTANGKIETRASRMQEIITPLPTALQYLQAWIQSVSHYYPSVHLRDRDTLLYLFKHTRKAIFGPYRWIRIEYLHEVCTYVGISGGTNPKFTAYMACIGLAIRNLGTNIFKRPAGELREGTVSYTHLTLPTTPYV